MPIHLPPISRRRFLVRSLAAGAGLALRPSLFAAEPPMDPTFWALLSDAHLDADRSVVERNVNMAEHFAAVSRELLALPKRPAGVVLLGDCAHRNGQKADYAVVADCLAPIRRGQMPVHLALGNHDNRERFWAAFEEEKAAKRPLADKQVAVLETAHANWFILDSLEKTLSTPGLLGREQLDWLAHALDARPQKPALVMVHHNPGLGKNLGLKDLADFYDVIRPRRQVKAYIFGHTHHWEIGKESSGIHLVNLPAIAYVFRAGDPSGWVRANVHPNGMRLELRCIDVTHKDQGQVVNLEWRT